MNFRNLFIDNDHHETLRNDLIIEKTFPQIPYLERVCSINLSKAFMISNEITLVMCLLLTASLILYIIIVKTSAVDLEK